MTKKKSGHEWGSGSQNKKILFSRLSDIHIIAVSVWIFVRLIVREDKNPDSDVRYIWRVIHRSKWIQFEPELSPLSSDKTIILWNKRRSSGRSKWLMNKTQIKITAFTGTIKTAEQKNFWRISAFFFPAGQKLRIYIWSWGISAVLAQRGWRSCLLERIRVLWEVGWTVCICGDANRQSCSLS